MLTAATIKATIGTLNEISDQRTFSLTLKNPCIEQSLVSIEKTALPKDLEYALWSYSETQGYQF